MDKSIDANGDTVQNVKHTAETKHDAVSEYGESNDDFTLKQNEDDADETNSMGADYSKDKTTNEIVYTCPLTKIEYVLNSDKTGWVLRPGKPHFDGSTYRYKDSNGIQYKWDLEGKTWVKDEDKVAADPNSQEENADEEESEEDDNTTDEDRRRRQYRKRKAAPGWGMQKRVYSTDPETGAQLCKEPDGTEYEWDTKKKAWFPRTNEDFMAQYQMNYGFTTDGLPQPTRPEEPKDTEGIDEKRTKTETEKAPPKKPQWFEDTNEKSTKVYVTGLPTENYDEEKFAALMGKVILINIIGSVKHTLYYFWVHFSTQTMFFYFQCGMIEIDIRSNKPKLKLYRENQQLKGDGLCTYMKQESVELALTILDGSIPYPEVCKDGVIAVQPAKFEMKGDRYDPKLKPKKMGKKEKERLEKKKEKMLAWEPDKVRGERSKREKVIVIENVFDTTNFDNDPSQILECSRRLREYCSKFGNVKKVCVYDKHEDGVCQVFFRSPEEADTAISMLDGRLYYGNGDKRVLKASTWDGKTKYKKNETEEEEKERLANWEKFLQEQENEMDSHKNPTTQSAQETITSESVNVDIKPENDSTHSEITGT